MGEEHRTKIKVKRKFKQKDKDRGEGTTGEVSRGLLNDRSTDDRRSQEIKVILAGYPQHAGRVLQPVHDSGRNNSEEPPYLRIQHEGFGPTNAGRDAAQMLDKGYDGTIHGKQKHKQAKRQTKPKLMKDAANSCYIEQDEDEVNTYVKLTDDKGGSYKIFGDYWIGEFPQPDGESCQPWTPQVPRNVRRATGTTYISPLGIKETVLTTKRTAQYGNQLTPTNHRGVKAKVEEAKQTSGSALTTQPGQQSQLLTSNRNVTSGRGSCVVAGSNEPTPTTQQTPRQSTQLLMMYHKVTDNRAEEPNIETGYVFAVESMNESSGNQSSAVQRHMRSSRGSSGTQFLIEKNKTVKLQPQTMTPDEQAEVEYEPRFVIHRLVDPLETIQPDNRRTSTRKAAVECLYQYPECPHNPLVSRETDGLEYHGSPRIVTSQMTVRPRRRPQSGTSSSSSSSSSTDEESASAVIPSHRVSRHTVENQMVYSTEEDEDNMFGQQVHVTTRRIHPKKKINKRQIQREPESTESDSSSSMEESGTASEESTDDEAQLGNLKRITLPYKHTPHSIRRRPLLN